MAKRLKPKPAYTRNTHKTAAFIKEQAKWEAKMKCKNVSADQEIKTYRISRPPETKKGFLPKHLDKLTYFNRVEYAIEDLRFYKKDLYPHLFRDDTDEFIMAHHLMGQSIRDIEEILEQDTHAKHKKIKTTTIYDRLVRMFDVLKMKMFEFNK